MTYLVLILSVLIGMVIVFGLKPSNKTVQLLLAFSGAYLLSITILSNIPPSNVVISTDKSTSLGLFSEEAKHPLSGAVTIRRTSKEATLVRPMLSSKTNILLN